ncbi:phosphoribosyltransferase family protein [Dinghuibacter silviterrae]|uniref:Phosphoribosyl transferase-like protein n=1 Tax=Dinghuibacter silviterrae TaxID=1539049 RepID=A0A4R8DT67_9BACT|nr:phosphoribosyltransferase family protein [Dinghuibacter silviterrae]TDX00607.1 phosphoribosyl transferase-like protein [Dinghuibacter silviterrae]
MSTSYALHKIKNEHHFGFDPDDYSRFKFGDEVVARAFGFDLAEGFIRAHGASLKGQVVVVPSPYSFIPTATFAMKNYFVFRLNRYLADRGLPVVQETKVHRTVTYKEDYGGLSADERIALIGNDAFHIDRAFLEGKTVLFLDDIRITGGHERMILKMVREYGLQEPLFLLYFAELVNPDIPPTIENFLNYHAIRSIFDLDALIRGGSFVLNTRAAKYILHYDFEAFRIFVEGQTDAFLEYLYDMAIGNGYHTMDAYRRNLDFIRANVQNKIRYGD